MCSQEPVPSVNIHDPQGSAVHLSLRTGTECYTLFRSVLIIFQREEGEAMAVVRHKEAIHSGHFMVSNFEAEEDDDDDEENIGVTVDIEIMHYFVPSLGSFEILAVLTGENMKYCHMILC
jgi:hypothetical protein